MLSCNAGLISFVWQFKVTNSFYYYFYYFFAFSGNIDAARTEHHQSNINFTASPKSDSFHTYRLAGLGVLLISSGYTCSNMESRRLMHWTMPLLLSVRSERSEPGFKGCQLKWQSWIDDPFTTCLHYGCPTSVHWQHAVVVSGRENRFRNCMHASGKIMNSIQRVNQKKEKNE